MSWMAAVRYYDVMYTKFWISCGVVVGVLAGFVAAQAPIFAKLEIDALAAFVGALIGAAATVGAAFAVTSMQINVRRRETAENIERQQLAARATLALDLSHLCTYTNECALVAKAVQNRSKISVIPDGAGARDRVGYPAACPELDPGITQRLQRLVELLDGDDADQIVALLNCFQVQHARLSGELTDYKSSGNFNFEFVMAGTVELRLRANSMFEFSRRQSKHISPPPYDNSEVANGLSSLNITNHISDEFRIGLLDQMGGLDPSGSWEQELE